MANKQRGQIKVTLDKVRTINYTLNALIELEDKLGVPLEQMGDIQMSIKNVRVLLWAGLIHEDEELTELQVGSLIDLTNLADVQAKVELAFAQADLGKN